MPHASHNEAHRDNHGIDGRLAEASVLLEHQRQIILMMDRAGHSTLTQLRMLSSNLTQLKRMERHAAR